MRRLSWSIVCLLVSIHVCFAQWEKTSPVEIDIPLDISSVAAQSGILFAGTYRGPLFRSTDGGNVWQEVGTGSLPSIDYTYTILLTANAVFAGTPDGIYRSTDGGNQWSLQSDSLYDVVSLAGQDTLMFAVCRYGVYLSRDLGDSWTADNSGLPRDSNGNIIPLNKVVVADSLVIVACRDGVYRRRFLDSAWSAANSGLPGDGQYHVRALCLSARGSQLFMGSDACAGSVYYSSNSGTTWIRMNEGIDTNLSGCYTSVYSLFDAGSFLLAGTQYGMYRSDNLGVTWKKFNAGLPLGPTSDCYVQCFACSDQRVFAATSVGLYQLLLADTIWSPVLKQYPGPVNYPILGASGENVFLIAYANYFNGRILDHRRSTNDGATWLIDTSSAIAHGGIFFKFGERFFSAGSGLFESSDDGLHWDEIDSGLIAVNALVARDSMMFAAYGTFYLNDDAGGVYRSSDKGHHWEVVGLQGTPVRSLALVGNDLFAYTKGVYQVPQLLKSTDAGTTWRNLDSLLPPGIHISALTAFDSVLFVGTNHGVYTSQDHGKSWQPTINGLPRDSSGTPFAVSTFFADPSNPSIEKMLFVILGKRFFMTNDGGGIWKPLDGGLPDDRTQLVAVAADDKELFLSSGLDVWYRSLSGLTLVSSPVSPEYSRLSLKQNYPNPFNPVTTFAYFLPARAAVTLEVFNTLGAQIATLIHEVQDAGPHSKSWNASSLPSGVYFCRVRVGFWSDTIKMLHLK
jgi:photosystem II stability/assembly factor-like uncharacterized protein